MDQAELEAIRERFAREVRERFPEAPVDRAEVLQYGDDPQIEPGTLMARVLIATPDDEEGRRRVFEAFHDQYREAVHELRDQLNKLPENVLLQITTAGDCGEGKPRAVIQLAHNRGGGRGPDGAGLTPVMARLGPEDLETLDMLITVGIASSRAEAVRWALARIRERPAFAQLRAHTREIEALKSQF